MTTLQLIKINPTKVINTKINTSELDLILTRKTNSELLDNFKRPYTTTDNRIATQNALIEMVEESLI